MKAKQYASNFIEKFNKPCDELPIENIKKEIGILGNAFLKEYDIIRIARNIDKGSKEQSLVNLIKEFNEKWKKMAYIINEYFIKKFDVTIMAYSGFLKIIQLQSSVCVDLIYRYKIK
jgi:hypothetical protein